MAVACAGSSNVTPTPASGDVSAGTNTQIIDASGEKKPGVVRVVVTIPGQSTQERRNAHPQYVSPSTRSMVIDTRSGEKRTFDLWLGAPGCSKDQSSGELTCSRKFELPSGTQTIVATLYDKSKGKGLGTALSTITTQVKIAAGKVVTLPIVTDGIPASAVVLLGQPGAASLQIPQGTPTTVPLSVSAYDARGNLIVPPGPYSTAIDLSDNDASGATKLSATAIKTPAKTVTLKYDGSSAFESAAISVSIGGVAQNSGVATLSIPLAITEYSLTPPAGAVGRPMGITLGPDNALWFALSRDSVIGRITTAGAISEFTAPAATGAITTGPDLAFWYTDVSGLLDRITTNGAVTEYTLAGPASGLGGIASGPDGALWGVNSYSYASGLVGDGVIAKITTSGAITSFPMPAPTPVSPSYFYTNSPQSIAAGPDRALWFGDVLDGWDPASPTGLDTYVDRITTAGVVTAQYLISNDGTGVSSITAGPDGALWFVSGNNIDRMTTTGTLSTYAPSGTATDIASGPDGALWFTETNAAYIVGRITTSGAITEYSGPSASSTAYSIAAGPDDAMWFTDRINGTIDRVPVGIAATNVAHKKQALRR